MPSVWRAVQPQLPVVPWRLSAGAPLTGRARMDLVDGMLNRLVDVTPAGQHYLMSKILRLLRRAALDPGGLIQPEHREALVRLFDELEWETLRLAPDPDTFERKARILVDALTLA